MKYGRNTENYEKMLNTAYGNGPTGEMTNFMVHGYNAWMKRKTFSEREEKALLMFMEMVEEMKDHLDEVRK